MMTEGTALRPVPAGAAPPPGDEGESPDPRAYMRLAAGLRRDIAAGRLKPGDPVPSIARMRQEHGHARQTGAKALRLLVDEGLLVRYPGLGYYVAPQAQQGGTR